MAKSKGIKKLPVSDRTLFYQTLAYMPTDYKESRLWMAQNLWFSKQNSQVLQKKDKAIIYRKTDELKINEQELKNLVDPPTPKDAGGKASYFAANWGAMPLDVHLDNILDTDVRTIPLNITCSLADPIAKLQEQKDKEKIINQRFVRNIINDFVKDLGLPKIGESEDPYKWIQKFTATDKDKTKIDTIGNAVDQIRTKIKDDDGLRLFQNYLYKNGLEVAFEIGIKYYLLDQNEYQTKYSHQFLRDLKHFNKVSGMWAIDEMTGQGTIRYIDPTQLYTSPFKDKNGDDILYWFFEENVNFADFERLVGADMTDAEKKKALQLQKQQGWATGANYSNSSNQNSSQVRIGYYCVLTQEANAFSEKYINDTTTVWDNKPLTWDADPDSGEEKKVKAYNVWYSCYYMPLNISVYNQNSPIDWAEQSKYIFHIRKDMDMMRYGADRRYAKSSLIVWKNETQASWTDIKEAYMPLINLLWQEFQNCIVQDVDGVAMSNELIAGMANAVDAANKEEDGGKSQVDSWKMMKQAGQGFFKFTDKNGNYLADPAKMFIVVKNGLFDKAEKVLLRIMDLYNVMTQSLAKGQAGEGLQPKARTAVAGIEIANVAASKATYFIEESYISGVIIPYAMRCAQHIHCMAKENKKYNYSKRWKQFVDVIGSYNGAVIESIEDINFENIGLTISNKDDSSKKEIVIQNVVQKAAQKQITTAALALIIGTENYKLQLVELYLEEAKQEEKAQIAAEQEHQRQMELKGEDLKIAQALNQAKTEGKNSNIQTQGQIDAAVEAQMSKLKAENMKETKDQLLKNKLIEHQQVAELDKDKKSHESNLKQQESLVGTT